MDTSAFADPVKVGPGIWFKLHTDAVTAVTDALKESFIINTNAVCNNFKCKTCQPHFRNFIDTHPFKDYWNIRNAKGEDIGMFQWTWELHNKVNKVLGKYEPTLEESYEYFTSPEVGACFNCGQEHPPAIVNAIQYTIPNTSNQVIPELRSRAIPPILTLYRATGDIKPQPFKLIAHGNK
jgi:hypothetical protein